MLKIRHAPVPESRSSASHVSDHVTMRKISDGRTYLQINLDRELTKDLCNPSTYQINSPWPFSGGPGSAEDHSKVTVPVSNPLMSPEKPDTNRAAPAARSQSIGSDGLGIMDDYPHLVLKDTRKEDQIKTGSQTNCTPVTLFPVLRPATGTAPGELWSTQPWRNRDQQLHEDGRQPVSLQCERDSSVETVLVRPRPATPNRLTNPKPLVTEQSTPPSSQQSSPYYALSMRPVQYTKQKSSDTVMSMCPRRNGHSKNSSTQSACGSFADDGRSDASSGIVMNAQSAEFIRAHGLPGFSNSSPRIKPPRPGPAPTRALPSLPEGHDIGNGVKSTMEAERAFPHVGQSTEHSKVKISPRSPSIVRRPPALKIVAPSKFRSPSWISATSEVPQCSPQRSTTNETPTTSGSTAAIDDSSSADIDSETLRQWKRQRAEATRALKKRDLEHVRARNQENEHDNPIGHIRDIAAVRSNDRVAISTSFNHPYVSQAVPGGYRVQGMPFKEMNDTHPVQKPKHHLNSTGNRISPILLIVEQEPTAWNLRQGLRCLSSPPSDRLRSKLFLDGISKPKTEAQSLNVTRSPPVLLPSPMEDSLEQHHFRHHTKPSATIPPQLPPQVNYTPRNLPPHQPSEPTNSSPTIESRLSAVENLATTLQSTIERKNLLLEAAIFAFLSSSRCCGAQCNVGHTSNGLSDQSETSGGCEKRLESQLEAMLGLVGRNEGKEEG